MSKEFRRDLLIGAVIGAVFWSVVCIASFLYFDYLAPETTAEISATEQIREFSQADAELAIGAKIPLSATDIHYSAYHLGWQDRQVFVSFKLVPEELDTFTRDLGFAEPLQEQYFPPNINTNYRIITWWKPNQAQAYLGGIYKPAYPELSILVDKTDPALYIIYVHIF